MDRTLRTAGYWEPSASSTGAEAVTSARPAFSHVSSSTSGSSSESPANGSGSGAIAVEAVADQLLQVIEATV